MDYRALLTTSYSSETLKAWRCQFSTFATLRARGSELPISISRSPPRLSTSFTSSVVRAINATNVMSCPRLQLLYRGLPRHRLRPMAGALLIKAEKRSLQLGRRQRLRRQRLPLEDGATHNKVATFLASTPSESSAALAPTQPTRAPPNRHRARDRISTHTSDQRVRRVWRHA